MGLKMNNCERLGISPRWPKLRSVLDTRKKINPDYDRDELKDISDYAFRADLLFAHKPIPNTSNVTNDQSEGLGRYVSQRCLIQALQDQPWLPELSKWNLYYQVGLKQSFFWHYKFNISTTRNRDLRMYSFQYAAEMLAITSILGWKDAVIYQGYMTVAALNRNYRLELEYKDEHRRAQALMLRLFCDWVGDVSHQWPAYAYAYDEPIYEALLANWRIPNPDDLVPCLLAACDRHTWQTGRNSAKNYHDFSTPAFMRVPIEILFLFRLREWQGLANPTLDHPLMAAPFDKLPPEQPIPPLDDLMQAVLKRAREDWPHYDEVLSLEELKKPIDQITLYDMPVKLANTAGNKQAKGLLARLFGK